MQRRTKPTKKQPTAHASAGAVMEFMNNGKVPDFLSNTIQATVDNACDHVGYARLSREPGLERVDMTILTNLCRRTRMLHITELEKSKLSLARHIMAVIEHPLTPGGLYDAICDFVTSGSNLKDEQGTSLLYEAIYNPRSIARIVEIANMHDKAEKAEEVTQ